MAREAELFVVCKNCGSEVSPYVTECPYCGQRVRKRAPKIERGGALPDPRSESPAFELPSLEPDEAKRRRRPKAPKPLRERRARRSFEEPRATLYERSGRRPVATIALVLGCFALYLLTVAGALDPTDVVIFGGLGGDVWRVFTAPFAHLDPGGSLVFAGGAYQFATMIAVGVFGWLLERRHGPLVVVVLFLLAGAGGMALTALIDPSPLAAGANGLGLGLLCAWAVPDLLAWRRDQEYEGDLLGTGVIAAVLLLMPLAVEFSSAIAGVTGAVAGLLVGLALTRLRGRDHGVA